MKHKNRKFDRTIKPELIQAGFKLSKTKNGYKIQKGSDVYFIHHKGGSKCLKPLERVLRKTFHYILIANIN